MLGTPQENAGAAEGEWEMQEGLDIIFTVELSYQLWAFFHKKW